MLCTIMYIAIAMINADITPPLAPSMIFCVSISIVPSLKVVSIVDSSVSIETQAEAKLIAFEAEYTGLLYLRYLITFMIAKVKEVKVYAAIIMVVISW